MKRRLMGFLLTLVLVAAVVPANTLAASAATTAAFPTLSTSAYCEFVASKNIYVYKDSACKTRGTSSPAQAYNAEIYTGDTCRILKITDTYINLQYPTSSGLKTGYIKRSDLIGVTAPLEKRTAQGQATTNTKAASSYYGYTEKGDAVYRLGASGSYVQIIYTAKSGSRAYKLGYVLASDYTSKIEGVVAPTGVSLSSTAKSLAVGSTAQLAATVSPSNATDKGVTWASSNTAVATVSSTGLVTGKAAGAATITVKTKTAGKTATCKVTVLTVDPTGVAVSPATKSLSAGATVQLAATVSPSNATDKVVTWSSSNTAIATVSSAGLVTGKAAGTATITAKTRTAGKTATCKVTVGSTVVEPSGITVSPTAKSITVGSTAQLTPTVSPSNATDKSVTWSSSNTAVATVSSTGLVTAKGVGTATITVKTKTAGKAATCQVTVPSVSPTGVTLSLTSKTLAGRSTVQLKETVLPSNATDKGVTWSSSNTAIATVSSAGLVTGKAAGTATITVKTRTAGKTATCKVTVTNVSPTGVAIPATKSLTIGSTAQLTPTVSPSNAIDKSVTWASSNTKVATVSTAGLVTAKAAGTATITVKTKTGGKSATCKVTVSNLVWQYPLKGAKCSWSGYNSSTWSWSEERYGKPNASTRTFHLGLDLTGSSTAVYPALDGTVAAASSSTQGANGRYVIIKHKFGGKTVYSFYAHLSSVSVKTGQTVTKSTKIGVVGGSGYGSNSYYGAHLHFAVVNTLWSNGAYYGYAYKFSGNSKSYEGVTYYNPKYIVSKNQLP